MTRDSRDWQAARYSLKFTAPNESTTFDFSRPVSWAGRDSYDAEVGSDAVFKTSPPAIDETSSQESISPEFREWAKELVENFKSEIPKIEYAVRSKVDFNSRDPSENVFPELPLRGFVYNDRPSLEETVAKMIHNTVYGLPNRTGLTDKEKEVAKSLIGRTASDVSDKGTEEWIKRNWQTLVSALKKYVEFYIQGYTHEEIHQQLLTAEERFAVNHPSSVQILDTWNQIKTNPEIQSLLSGQDSLPDAYTSMSDSQLQQEAERASEDLYSATRTGGLMIFAPSGWGKSRLLGRGICYAYAKAQIGTVVLDVVGGTIDNALDTIARHKPVTERQEIGSRIRYCNMAGERIGDDVFVTGWPMLAKRSRDESFYTTSQRIVDLIATTDVNLSTASIQGLNRVAPLLTALGIVLSECGLPLSHSFDLLEQPKAWNQYLTQVTTPDPEVQEAKRFLLAFLSLPEREQELRSEVLKNKLSFLRFDAVSRAMFSARDPLINWSEVAAQGLQVYIDFRNETSAKALEMKLFWVWNSVMEFIRSRGSSGRHLPPLAVVIDELSYFVRGSQLNTEAISEEFREFVQVRRRNANVLLTASTQERAELPPAMQAATLQLPSHLYGATSNPETAVENAQRWYKKDPKKRKGRPTVVIERQYPFSDKYVPVGITRYILEPGSDRGEYLSLEEQDYMHSLRWLQLPKAEWLFAKSPAEGVPPSGLQHITTAKLDPGKYVQEEVVSQFRRLLMQRDGIPVSPILSELTNLSGKQPPPEAAGGAKVAQSPTPLAPFQDSAAPDDAPDGSTGRDKAG